MISAFTAIWTAVATFITGLFGNIATLFITEASGTYTLTFVGTLGVIMAGVSLMLLVFNIVRSFLIARA